MATFAYLAVAVDSMPADCVAVSIRVLNAL